MKKIIFVFTFIFVANQSLGFEYFPPLMTQQQIEERQTLQESYPRVDNIERQVFSRAYKNQDLSRRLERLENRMFGRKYAHQSLAQRLENITQHMKEDERYSGISINELVKTENKIFNRNFTGDTIENRIIRLEKEMLGAMQSGDLSERLAVLQEASKHYNNFANHGYANQNFSRFQRGTGFKNFFKNILGGLGSGVMTGYTPPIYDSYGYTPNQIYNYSPNSNFLPYEMASPTFQNQYRTPYGYYNEAYTNQSGSTVRILD